MEGLLDQGHCLHTAHGSIVFQGDLCNVGRGRRGYFQFQSGNFRLKREDHALRVSLDQSEGASG
ncbi:MAG: hypothetical protein JWM16_1216 [Verrucomicrobiales bacterium]|nr:hypothetical protein [Verrucomicrobiales bacterium]